MEEMLRNFEKTCADLQVSGLSIGHASEVALCLCSAIAELSYVIHNMARFKVDDFACDYCIQSAL